MVLNVERNIKKKYIQCSWCTKKMYNFPKKVFVCKEYIHVISKKENTTNKKELKQRIHAEIKNEKENFYVFNKIIKISKK
jgi:hypothetical protein